MNVHKNEPSQARLLVRFFLLAALVTGIYVAPGMLHLYELGTAHAQTGLGAVLHAAKHDRETRNDRSELWNRSILFTGITDSDRRSTSTNLDEVVRHEAEDWILENDDRITVLRIEPRWDVELVKSGLIDTDAYATHYVFTVTVHYREE